MKNLNIIERHNGNVTILDLAGNIRMGDDLFKLKTALRVIAGDGEKNILLNMADIVYIDSSGLGELVAGYVFLEKNGAELKLFNLTDHISELMIITKLLTVFAVFNSEAEAVNSFQNTSEFIDTGQSEFVTGKLDRALLNQ